MRASGICFINGSSLALFVGRVIARLRRNYEKDTEFHTFFRKQRLAKVLAWYDTQILQQIGRVGVVIFFFDLVFDREILKIGQIF